jgi:hypothetical protein
MENKNRSGECEYGTESECREAVLYIYDASENTTKPEGET